MRAAKLVLRIVSGGEILAHLWNHSASPGASPPAPDPKPTPDPDEGKRVCFDCIVKADTTLDCVPIPCPAEKPNV